MKVRAIRPTAEDAERLAEIAQAASPERTAPWTAADFLRLAEMPGGVLLSDDEISDGFIAVRAAAGEAEVIDLSVVPDARRKGLGRALLGQAIDLAVAEGAKRIFLEVAEDNIPALKLYGHVGFAEVGRRLDYYLRPDGSRTDALVLATCL